MDDIINQIDGNVQVIFQITPDVGYPYRDALWFTQEVYDTLTQVEIDAMKQERFDNWVNLRAEWATNPPVEEPVVEETVVDTQTVTEEPVTGV